MVNTEVGSFPGTSNIKGYKNEGAEDFHRCRLSAIAALIYGTGK